MVLQMPVPQKGRVFIASSDENQDLARREVLRWAYGHGYGQPETDNTYTLFGPGAEPREWVLLERAGVSSRTVSDTEH